MPPSLRGLVPNGSDVRDRLLEAVERRFGTHRAPEQVEVLSDNGSACTARETRIFAQQSGLKSCSTPVKSPQSNGMSFASGLEPMARSLAHHSRRRRSATTSV